MDPDSGFSNVQVGRGREFDRIKGMPGRQQEKSREKVQSFKERNLCSEDCKITEPVASSKIRDRQGFLTALSRFSFSTLSVKIGLYEVDQLFPFNRKHLTS